MVYPPKRIRSSAAEPIPACFIGPDGWSGLVVLSVVFRPWWAIELPRLPRREVDNKGGRKHCAQPTIVG